MGAFLYFQSREDLPGGLGDPLDVMRTFHQRSTDCMLTSNYAYEPNHHTLQALLINIRAEFMRMPENYFGIWVLSGVVGRLAIRMGYHREPANFAQISPFQGEMRRRTWALICQLESLTCCHLGLPSFIQENHCDTQLPNNYLDEDIDPDNVELPQPRPGTEQTPVLYTITKGRIVSVFRTICDQTLSVQVTPYDQIIALDERLRGAIQAIPPCFRLDNLQDCLTVPPYLLVRRYNMELLSQKARCILHRHYMTVGYRDPKYAYSRSSCVAGALSLLRNQAEIFEEVQTGGRLVREKWFISSLDIHDYLLASMIACLELSFRSHPPGGLNASEPLQGSQKDLIDALLRSCQFWEGFHTTSPEIRRASAVMSAMIAKVLGSSAKSSHKPSAMPMGIPIHSDLDQQVHPQSTSKSPIPRTKYQPESSTRSNMIFADSFAGSTAEDNSPSASSREQSSVMQTNSDNDLGNIEEMLTDPNMVDWVRSNGPRHSLKLIISAR
ncbi:uncharacterized protein A1O9_05114 [Exophiala aquamarina CBS 119918]|uniref:Xylanolytic transcriptional activator regulatory domain-containing protein n=1 Tax=Exophiala aquamarina CBS 119918 TaxID=1182545 RepID=A0A072PJL9_9EURO|nr:uncharacterized protein A1O9_05114 [Exophiala aquamarina CBS 119918]KEF60264.1 hypothetical protein A1O9_05114 [Exophiala aquamarina CBS 119918]